MGASTVPVHRRIESRLESLIQQGTLRPGDRLPSVREISRREGVSPGSAVQALSNLEARSLIHARPRSGFFVSSRYPLPLPTASVEEIQPVSGGVSDDVARIFQDLAHPDVIPLGAGFPDPGMLPARDIARCVSRVARLSPSDFAKYHPGQGALDLRRELARRFALDGCQISPNEIILTNGCMDALNLTVRAVARPGDIIAIESPGYFGTVEMLDSLGMQTLSIPSSCEEGIDLEILARSFQKYDVRALILIPHFGNPHGATLSPERQQKLAEILNKANIPLIEDDIYRNLYFERERPHPVRRLYPHTLLCGSLSKTISPGLRVGWVAAGRFREKILRLKMISNVATNHTNEKAAADYLRSGTHDRHLRSLREQLQRQMSRASSLVAENFPAGTAISRPKGGYFLWVELPEGTDAVRLRDRAFEEGISICPGPVFSTEKRWKNFIRLNCALGWSDRVEKAFATLGHLAQQERLHTTQPRSRRMGT